MLLRGFVCSSDPKIAYVCVGIFEWMIVKGNLNGFECACFYESVPVNTFKSWLQLSVMGCAYCLFTEQIILLILWN